MPHLLPADAQAQPNGWVNQPLAQAITDLARPRYETHKTREAAHFSTVPAAHEHPGATRITRVLSVRCRGLLRKGMVHRSLSSPATILRSQSRGDISARGPSCDESSATETSPTSSSAGSASRESMGRTYRGARAADIQPPVVIARDGRVRDRRMSHEVDDLDAAASCRPEMVADHRSVPQHRAVREIARSAAVQGVTAELQVSALRREAQSDDREVVLENRWTGAVRQPSGIRASPVRADSRSVGRRIRQGPGARVSAHSYCGR
jgi:hypothetical protein